MPQNDNPKPMMKHLGKAALVLPVAAMPAFVAQAQDQYKVVINHEEQYSIWPAERENALGWNDVGKEGSKEDCMTYIEEVWTDMRPLSLRKKMQELNMPRDKSTYKVVINHEEQYSIRLTDQELERPWRATGETCTWDACRAYIEEVWTDMRPLSVRKK